MYIFTHFIHNACPNYNVVCPYVGEKSCIVYIIISSCVYKCIDQQNSDVKQSMNIIIITIS